MARGWKHVTGGQQGSVRRPHLTANSKLMGTGRFAPPPGESLEYQRGYLCGLIRGDGHVGYCRYERDSGKQEKYHTFRLALADKEALTRAQRYLLEIGVRTRQVIDWPGLAGEDWCKGFLAGIFDAEVTTASA